MKYYIRLTLEAKQDLVRLYEFLLERDERAANQARKMIRKSIEALQLFPFSCRKVNVDNPFLRELIIDYGHSGYVALFDISEQGMITILAIRHQLEDDYF